MYIHKYNICTDFVRIRDEKSTIRYDTSASCGILKKAHQVISKLRMCNHDQTAHVAAHVANLSGTLSPAHSHPAPTRNDQQNFTDTRLVATR